MAAGRHHTRRALQLDPEGRKTQIVHKEGCRCLGNYESSSLSQIARADEQTEQRIREGIAAKVSPNIISKLARLIEFEMGDSDMGPNKVMILGKLVCQAKADIMKEDRSNPDVNSRAYEDAIAFVKTPAGWDWIKTYFDPILPYNIREESLLSEPPTIDNPQRRQRLQILSIRRSEERAEDICFVGTQFSPHAPSQSQVDMDCAPEPRPSLPEQTNGFIMVPAHGYEADLGRTGLLRRLIWILQSWPIAYIVHVAIEGVVVAIALFALLKIEKPAVTLLRQYGLLANDTSS